MILIMLMFAPTTLPRCLLVWCVAAGVALMFGVLLMMVDLTGPRWRG